MTGEPTLAQVRAWVAVPATAISDEDLQQILDGELAIQARTCRVPESGDPGPVTVVVDEYTVTVTVEGGIPGEHYRFSWGDGQNGDANLDDNGDVTGSHTYDLPGTFTTSVTDDHGQTVYYGITIPGSGSGGSVTPSGLYPAALSRACLRRCQRQIAAKNLPLGVIGQDGAEFGPLTVPSWDAEIRRLEASYRIPVIA